MLANLTRKLNRRRRRGQGMTEYIIIVGLIAILLVGAVSKFKDALNNAFTGSTTVLENKVSKPINDAAKGSTQTAPNTNPGGN